MLLEFRSESPRLRFSENPTSPPLCPESLLRLAEFSVERSEARRKYKLLAGTICGQNWCVAGMQPTMVAMQLSTILQALSVGVAALDSYVIGDVRANHCSGDTGGGSILRLPLVVYRNHTGNQSTVFAFVSNIMRQRIPWPLDTYKIPEVKMTTSPTFLCVGMWSLTITGMGITIITRSATDEMIPKPTPTVEEVSEQSRRNETDGARPRRSQVPLETAVPAMTATPSNASVA